MQETIEYIKQAFELKSQQCYKQAIEMLYKALELESDNIEILFQLGELYFLLNNFARSQQYLEKVLLQNENHVETLEILEKIYVYSNELSKAFSIAERIFNIQKNQKSILKLIEISSKRGDLDKVREFENSDDDKIIYEIAKAYYNNKKFDEAKTKLEQAHSINPDNEDVQVLLGKIYFDRSEFDKSREIFNKFSKTSENHEILNYLGLFALEDLNFIEAIKFFSKASNLDKQNAKYCYNLGNAYFYNGWIDEAVKAYQKAICMEPDNNGYRYSLAYLYFEQKIFDKAQREID